MRTGKEYNNGLFEEPRLFEDYNGDSFIVHKHDSYRRHWDITLKIGKILKMWRLPKEFPTNFNVKRLAILSNDAQEDIKHFKMEEWTWDCGACRFLYFDLDRRFEFKPKGSKIGGIYILNWWRDDEWLLWLESKWFLK